jgi:hypothetical protein
MHSLRIWSLRMLNQVPAGKHLAPERQATVTCDGSSTKNVTAIGHGVPRSSLSHSTNARKSRFRRLAAPCSSMADQYSPEEHDSFL